MKKIILAFLFFTVSLITIKAQSEYFDGNGVEKGYRGFVDLGYTIGIGDYGEGRFEMQTSHGYQFLPYFYMGVGAGMSYFHESKAVAVPVFADLRADFFNNSITPFVDFKVGYSVADVTGFYMSPSLGCRFGLKQNLALNFSVGYTMQKYDWETYYFNGTENCGGLNIRLGVEF